MSIYSIHFSPTGGTLNVMNILSKELGKAKQIDLCARFTDFSKFEMTADDICLVGVPSFGGRVPGVAIERMVRKPSRLSYTETVLSKTHFSN